MVIEAARANGWTAEAEVSERTPSGELWRADVLATQGRHRVAVEVQWSSQTREEAEFREEKYKESGVRGLWIMRRAECPPREDLPAVAIRGSLGKGFVVLVPKGEWIDEAQEVPLDEFLDAVFSRRFRFGVRIGDQGRATLYIGRIFCWACGAETKIVQHISIGFGPSRKLLEFELSTWKCSFSVPDFDSFPAMMAELISHIPKELEVGAIKRRYSNPKKSPYLSNGCFHCDKLIGAKYEHNAALDFDHTVQIPLEIDERWHSVLTRRKDYAPGWAVYEASSSAPSEVRAPDDA